MATKKPSGKQLGITQNKSLPLSEVKQRLHDILHQKEGGEKKLQNIDLEKMKQWFVLLEKKIQGIEKTLSKEHAEVSTLNEQINTKIDNVKERKKFLKNDTKFDKKKETAISELKQLAQELVILLETIDQKQQELAAVTQELQTEVKKQEEQSSSPFELHTKKTGQQVAADIQQVITNLDMRWQDLEYIPEYILAQSPKGDDNTTQEKIKRIEQKVDALADIVHNNEMSLEYVRNNKDNIVTILNDIITFFREMDPVEENKVILNKLDNGTIHSVTVGDTEYLLEAGERITTASLKKAQETDDYSKLEIEVTVTREDTTPTKLRNHKDKTYDDRKDTSFMKLQTWIESKKAAAEMSGRRRNELQHADNAATDIIQKRKEQERASENAAKDTINRRKKIEEDFKNQRESLGLRRQEISRPECPQGYNVVFNSATKECRIQTPSGILQVIVVSALEAGPLLVKYKDNSRDEGYSVPQEVTDPLLKQAILSHPDVPIEKKIVPLGGEGKNEKGDTLSGEEQQAADAAMALLDKQLQSNPDAKEKQQSYTYAELRNKHEQGDTLTTIEWEWLFTNAKDWASLQPFGLTVEDRYLINTEGKITKILARSVDSIAIVRYIIPGNANSAKNINILPKQEVYCFVDRKNLPQGVQIPKTGIRNGQKVFVRAIYAANFEHLKLLVTNGEKDDVRSEGRLINMDELQLETRREPASQPKESALPRQEAPSPSAPIIAPETAQQKKNFYEQDATQQDRILRTAQFRDIGALARLGVKKDSEGNDMFVYAIVSKSGLTRYVPAREYIYNEYAVRYGVSKQPFTEDEKSFLFTQKNEIDFAHKYLHQIGFLEEREKGRARQAKADMKKGKATTVEASPASISAAPESAPTSPESAPQPEQERPTEVTFFGHVFSLDNTYVHQTQKEFDHGTPPVEVTIDPAKLVDGNKLYLRTVGENKSRFVQYTESLQDGGPSFNRFLEKNAGKFKKAEEQSLSSKETSNVSIDDMLAALSQEAGPEENQGGPNSVGAEALQSPTPPDEGREIRYADGTPDVSPLTPPETESKLSLENWITQYAEPYFIKLDYRLIDRKKGTFAFDVIADELDRVIGTTVTNRRVNKLPSDVDPSVTLDTFNNKIDQWEQEKRKAIWPHIFEIQKKVAAITPGTEITQDMQKQWFLSLPDWVQRSEKAIIMYLLNASQNKKLLAMQDGKLFRTNVDANNEDIANALPATEDQSPTDQPANEPDQPASDAPVLPPEAAPPVGTLSPVSSSSTSQNLNIPPTSTGAVPPVGAPSASPAAPSIPPTPAPSAPPSSGAKASPSLTSSGQEALTRARREYVRAETMYTKLAQEAVATRPKGLGIVSAFKKLFGKEDWARASNELNKIERYEHTYKEARATYVATDVSLFLQEQKALELYKWQHERDSKTGLEKMVGGVREFLSGGYKVLGDINVANAWTGSGRKLPDSAVGQFFLRTASLRTGISLALLGAGVGALAAGAWAPAALAIGTRRVLGGIGTSYGLYEIQRNSVLKNMKEALGVGANSLSPDSMPLLSLRDELTKIAGLTAYEGVDIKKSQYAAYYDKLQKELDKRFNALQDDPAPQPGTTPIRPSQTKEQKQKVFMEIFFDADAQDLTQAQRQHLQSIDSTAKNIAIGAAGAFVGTGAAGYVLGELAGKPFVGEQVANTTNTPQLVAPRMSVQDIPSKNTGIPPSNEGTIKKLVPNKAPQFPRGVPPPNLTPRSDVLPPFEPAPSGEQPLPKNSIAGEPKDRLVWGWESDTKLPSEFQGIPELKSEHMKSLIEYGPYTEEQKQALVNYAEQLDQLEPVLGSPKALANTLKDASFIDNTAVLSQLIQSGDIEQDPLIQSRITQEVENFRNAKELFKKNIGSQSFRELEKMLVEHGNLKDQFPVPYQSGVQLNYYDNPGHQGVFEQQKQLFLEKRFKNVLKESLLKKLNSSVGI